MKRRARWAAKSLLHLLLIALLVNCQGEPGLAGPAMDTPQILRGSAISVHENYYWT